MKQMDVLVLAILIIKTIPKTMIVFILIFHQSLDLLNFENRSQPWRGNLQTGGVDLVSPVCQNASPQEILLGSF